MSKLLSRPFQQTVVKFETGDIPASPQMLMFFYIDIEKRLRGERMGFINLDDLFENSILSNKEKFEFFSLMKRFNLITYENQGNRIFKVWLKPKSKAFLSGNLTIHKPNGYKEMLEIIDCLNVKTGDEN
jgi:hypothetical protein